jgi:hypothetical protein
MRFKNRLGGVLAAVTVAATLMAPAALAHPRVASPAAGVTCDPSAVPPPPSSIAASAAKEYELLRACGAQNDTPTVASAPAAADPPSSPIGFDWVSAAIGAIAAAGLSLAFAATAGMRRRVARARVTSVRT